MKTNQFISIAIIFCLYFNIGCKTEPAIIKESWINDPVSEWPDFALSNEISFTDTTFIDLANSFLVNTGLDTIGVSCKHLFMVFDNQLGLTSIDLGKSFKYWNLYPKNKKNKIVSVKRLINKNEKESIGQFNTLKVRDWIIFDLDNKRDDLFPLKIRYTPIRSNEIVYAVGWGVNQKNNKLPALIKLQCIKSLGNYYYIKTLNTEINPEGRSGSPVIDKNGYLVGIVSGQEGNLGVIGSVHYLKGLFDNYKVKYIIPGK